MRGVEAGSLRHSSGLLGIAAIVGRMASLGLLVVLSRAAGQGAVAFYGLGTLTASFISLGASLGLTTYATRAVASKELTERQLRAIHTARGLVLVGAIAILTAFSVRFVSHSYAIGFALFASAAVLDQWNETAWPAVRGTSRALRETAVNVVTNSAALCVILALWTASGMSFDEAALIWLGSAVVRALLACAATGVWPVAGRTQIKADVPTAVKRALPYLGSDILGLAYLRGDTFVLAFFVSASVLGNYVSASGYVMPLVQVASAMGLGALAKLGRDGPDRDAGEVIAFFTRTGLVISCLLVALVPIAVQVMYGHGHSAITVLALILCAFVPMRFVNSAFSSILLVYGGVRARLVIVLLSVVVNVALNVCLDGPLAARGAALATVLTEAFISFSFLFILRRSGVAVIGSAMFWALPAAGLVYATAMTMVASAAGHVLAWDLLFLGLHLGLLCCVAVTTRRPRKRDEGTPPERVGTRRPMTTHGVAQ